MNENEFKLDLAIVIYYFKIQSYVKNVNSIFIV